MFSQNRMLLRLHIEAVWHVRLPALLSADIDLVPDTPQPTWKLCVAELAEEGHIYIWRPDIAPLEREMLRQQVDEALTLPFTPLPGVSREVAFSQSAHPRIDRETAYSTARLLTLSDRSLLEAFQNEPPDDYYFLPEKQPLIGVVRDGRLLSLAHSSRRTGEACELGIETLPAARCQGFALAATILWTEAIRQEGLVPLYSALAENTASLRLAEAAGYRPFARAATFMG
jgi:RimJ/RimL family protein N-acetyltransferase